MKKSWKERLYDISCSRFAEKHIPTLPLGLAIFSSVCMFVFAFLFEGLFLPTILYCMFWILPFIGLGLRTIFDAVKSYKKETFLYNKIRNSLLANEAFLSSILIWTLLPVLILIVGIIFNPETYYFRVTSLSGAFFIGFLIIAISKPISKYFKKKLVYLENENTNVKCN